VLVMTVSPANTSELVEMSDFLKEPCIRWGAYWSTRLNAHVASTLAVISVTVATCFLKCCTCANEVKLFNSYDVTLMLEICCYC